MGWSALAFLAEPWFVIPWYAVGLAGLAYVAWDVRKRDMKKAMKWAWPIIVLFLAPIGLLLYETSAGKKSGFSRVNGAVIHCVAGDGLGIMSAMVIARATSLTFWQEFWFEYAVGFSFGWLIFQRMAMGSLAKAFRAEFFSMLTVMGGMGAVMTFVTPAVVGAQPKPLTFAFWGFGMLGLLAGYVLTFPMNAMLVKIGWKHGEHPIEAPAAKAAMLGAMVATGAAALALVFGLTRARTGVPLAGAPAAHGIQLGAFESVLVADEELAAGRRREATNALDSARRAAEVGAEALPNSGFPDALHDVESARHALAMGDPRGARDWLGRALGDIAALRESGERIAKPLRAYEGAPVVNAQGVVIGKIRGVDGDRVRLALRHRTITVTKRELLFGPAHHLGRSFVMLV